MSNYGISFIAVASLLAVVGMQLKCIVNLCTVLLLVVRCLNINIIITGFILFLPPSVSIKLSSRIEGALCNSISFRVDDQKGDVGIDG